MVDTPVNWTIAATASAVAMSIVCATGAEAQSGFENKPITIVVGAATGSAYNVYSRILARHMGKHVPGTPGFIVQNMPGAGSMKAAEYLYTQAPKDGSVFAILFPGALIEPLLSPGRFRYDPNKFEYLGTIDQDTRACMTSGKSAVKTFDDARKSTAIMAGTQAGSTTVDYPNMLNALTGTKFKVVPGYQSTEETMLAIERGEADGMCTNLSVFASQRPKWMGTSEANMLLHIAINPHPDVVTYKIPSIFDLAQDDAKPVLELIATQQVFGRPFALPPDTSPAQTKVLRSAFMATMADADFIKDVTALKLDVNPLDGESVSALIKKMLASPKDSLERMAKSLKPNS